MVSHSAWFNGKLDVMDLGPVNENAARKECFLAAFTSVAGGLINARVVFNHNFRCVILPVH
jgi:hypothetical protein